jgi:hypothetical protein
MHNNGQRIVMARENRGVAAVLASAPVTATTTNMLLRLDRDIAAGVVSGLYSVDGGETWQLLGSVAQVLNSPRLGIIVGASARGFPVATVRTVQVVPSTVSAPLPQLSIDNLSVVEGNAGTGNALFTVTLSAASTQTVTVSYATANGTASAPADYTAVSGTLTFAPGTTTQQITVPVIGDLLDEPNETFVVNLSGATNATIAAGQGVGTIVDDDPAPSLSLNDVSVTEGNTGTTNAVFTVTLSAASGQPVTVNYATANGTATAPADYTAASGTLTFTPGTTTQQITVAVVGDVVAESNETFTVNLSGATNATIARAQGVATIANDDEDATQPISITIDHVTANEGRNGRSNFRFTVTLSSPSSRLITVRYETVNGSATAGSDYVAASGTLTFNPGVTTQTISVAVNGDRVVEPDETFFVNLSAAVNATISLGQGVGTILNDD